MGARAAYAPGTFSFVELATPEPDDAVAFYAELLGWSAAPAAPGGLVMMRLAGRDAAAIDALAGGERPGWISYVTVASAAEAVDLAVELGGTAEAVVEIAGAGTTATVVDPVGASAALWAPGGHVGAAVVNDPGAFCWNELLSPDLARAERFWAELLGWQLEDGDASWPPGYRLASVDGQLNAGLRGAPARPSRWLVYFTVEEVVEACDHALELGGGLLERPQPLYAGTFAVLSDRQGLEFAVWEGEPDP